MGFFDRIINPGYHKALKKAKKISSSPQQTQTKSLGALDDSYLYSTGDGYSTTRRKSRAQVAQAVNDNPWLAAVVFKIAESVASELIKIGYESKIKGGKAIKSAIPYMKDAKQLKAIKQKLSQEQFKEVLEHPLLDLLRVGNSTFSGHDLICLYQVFMDIVGECFFFVERKQNSDQPVALWPIPPHWVTCIPNGNIDYYDTILGQFTQKDIIWWKIPDPVNPYARGYGSGLRLNTELDTQEYLSTLIKAAFGNKGQPSGVLSLDGASPEQAKIAKAEFENAHRGVDNYGRTFFTSGKSTFSKLNQSFEELKLIDLRKDIRDIIHQVYGVPPEVMGIIEKSNRATINGAETIMAKYVVTPRLNRLARNIHRSLVPLYDNRLVVWYDNIIPEDRELNIQAMSKAPYNYTRNQWQEVAGHEGFGDEGEVFMQPLNLVEVPLGQTAPPQNPTPPPSDDTKSIKKKTVNKTLTLSDIPFVVDALDPDFLRDNTNYIMDQELEMWANNVLHDTGVAVSFDMSNPAVISHLAHYSSTRIVQINATTQQAVALTLAEGVKNGEPLTALQKRITDVFNEGNLAIDKVRAKRIARTETGNSANFGTQEAWKQSGVIEKKQWLTAFNNSRVWHEAANNQTVPLEQPFIVNGEAGMHPGAFPSADNVVNCLCTMRVPRDDIKDVVPHAGKDNFMVWKDFLQDTKPWWVRLEEGFKKGLREQEANAIRVLNEVY